MAVRATVDQHEVDTTQAEHYTSENKPQSTKRELVSMGSRQFCVEDSRNPLEHAKWTVHKFLMSKAVQFSVAAVILMNCTTVGIELQSGKPLGVPGTIFEIFETSFLCVYVVELGLRFFAYGMACLYDHWVKFDLVVVLSGVVEQWILIPLNATFPGPGVLVILRILRLFRLARSFRLLIEFREMAIVIEGLMSSLSLIIYVLTLMFVMLFIFACVGQQLVGSYADDPDVDPLISELAHRYFSTVTVSMLTLVQFVCLDAISAIYEPMVKEKPILAFYFLGTILVVGIVLMNLITAVMVNTAIDKAQGNRGVMLEAAKEKSKKLAFNLKQLFHRLDEDGSNDLSKEEFLALSDEHMMLLNKCLPNLEPIDIFEAVDLDNSGTVDIDGFGHGIMSLVKSGASPEMRKTWAQVDNMHGQLRQLLANQQVLFQHLGMAPAEPREQPQTLQAPAPVVQMHQIKDEQHLKLMTALDVILQEVRLSAHKGCDAKQACTRATASLFSASESDLPNTPSRNGKDGLDIDVAVAKPETKLSGENGAEKACKPAVDSSSKHGSPLTDKGDRTFSRNRNEAVTMWASV